MSDRLLSLASRVLAESSVDRVLTTALDGMIRLVAAERGMILLFGPGGEVHFEVARNLEQGDLDRPELEVSRSLIEQVRDSGSPFYSHNLLDDPALGPRQSVQRLRLLSVICQPIRHLDHTFGVLYLDHRHATGLFSEDDAAVAGRFAELISLAAHHALERQRLERRVAELAAEVRRGFEFDAIVGDDPAMVDLLQMVSKVADSEVTVLVSGESGTGKELIARALHHNNRRRRDHPFVTVNCGALPETLLESELFGHRRGAFTGAVRDQEGWFARARGGTLFLDEVGELPPALQVKLLRVLESGDFAPLGATRTQRADVRLVAATNRDLEADVEGGRMRRDFYYRLNVVELRVPPLRQRRGDVELLARHFLAELAERHGHPPRRLSAAARRSLLAYDFPGNVRELRNALERAVLLADGDTVTPDHLPAALRRAGAGSPATQLVTESCRCAPEARFQEAKRSVIEEFERGYVTRCLAASGGNIAAAARAAGVDYKNFYTKVKHYSIEPSEFKGSGRTGG